MLIGSTGEDGESIVPIGRWLPLVSIAPNIFRSATQAVGVSLKSLKANNRICWPATLTGSHISCSALPSANVPTKAGEPHG